MRLGLLLSSETINGIRVEVTELVAALICSSPHAAGPLSRFKSNLNVPTVLSRKCVLLGTMARAEEGQVHCAAHNAEAICQ